MYKHYNSKVITVHEMDEVVAPWGCVYSIYQDSAEFFYMDADDGSDEVLSMIATTKEDAIKELTDRLAEIQKESEEEA